MWTNILAIGLALLQVASACESFGVDFKDNGDYFININSNDSFTAVSEFYNCQEPARAILITPRNQSIFCSDVATSPDYTDETTTCPILKNQMYSGDWTLLLLDNNGNASTFSAKRRLHLDVGEQVTSVVIPTITLSVTQTPTSTVNATITDVESTTLPPSSVTSLASNAETQTVTYYPPRETITKSSTATVTRTSTRFTYTVKTYTETEICAVAFAALPADPTADASLLSIASAAIASASATPAPGRRARIRRDITKVVQVERRNVVNLAKRTPDSATVTSTDTNTAHWASVTSSCTAVPVTHTAYTTVESTTTITPAPITIVATGTTVTQTAPTFTRTIIKRTTTTSKITKTVTATLSITSWVPGPNCF
ncbi:hypothetical protein QM012_000317 [Aureobasidium pullulans]|uniref:P-loop containing nucleoside triphosphate hydrolase protein n=1 Tax=Aureobasidium pullulans TaxID=5580 RepID=A0ABR0TVC4_AURPU